MAQFAYKVRDEAGAQGSGVLQAATLEEARLLLRGEGKYVVALERASAAPDRPDDADGLVPGRIRRAEVITFSHQIAVMVDTGVPISEALRCITDQCVNPAFRSVLADVAAHVAAGGDLSGALAKHPRVFPTVMVSLVRASEVSGTMGPMLERVSVYLQKEHATLRKVRGALLYPAFMLAMVVAVLVFLVVFVLPQFSEIYASRGAALPAPTRLLIAVSDAAHAYLYEGLAGVALAAATAVFGARTHAGRSLLDTLKLRAPVLGPLFTKLYLTRGFRTLGAMVAAGVPLLDMVAIVRVVTANVHYEALWDEVDRKLRQGSQLSEPLLAAGGLIPRSVAQMIHSGEKAGRLGQVMERIAEYTEAEFDEQVKTSTQLIEPALVALMGLVIGFVAIALLLPIFSIGKVMAGP